MKKGFTTLIVFVAMVLSHQLHAQTMADLAGYTWKDASEAIAIIDHLAEQKDNPITGDTQSVGLLGQQISADSELAIRQSVLTSIRQQLSAQQPVAQAILTGYENVLNALQSQDDFNDLKYEACRAAYAQAVEALHQ